MSHFIRVEENKGHREFVMFDAEEPGAIVRWWMTFYLAQDGIIRIYLDHSTVPVVQGPPHELLSGNLLVGPPFAVSVHEGVPVYEPPLAGNQPGLRVAGTGRSAVGDWDRHALFVGRSQSGVRGRG